jgi:hypothetical protein
MNEENKKDQDKERSWERDWDQEKTSAKLDDDAESLNEKE